MESISINNSFKKFYSKGSKRNRAVAGGRYGAREIFGCVCVCVFREKMLEYIYIPMRMV